MLIFGVSIISSTQKRNISAPQTKTTPQVTIAPQTTAIPEISSTSNKTNSKSINPEPTCPAGQRYCTSFGITKCWDPKLCP